MSYLRFYLSLISVFAVIGCDATEPQTADYRTDPEMIQAHEDAFANEDINPDDDAEFTIAGKPSELAITGLISRKICKGYQDEVFNLTLKDLASKLKTVGWVSTKVTEDRAKKCTYTVEATYNALDTSGKLAILTAKTSSLPTATASSSGGVGRTQMAFKNPVAAKQKALPDTWVKDALSLKCDKIAKNSTSSICTFSIQRVISNLNGKPGSLTEYLNLPAIYDAILASITPTQPVCITNVDGTSSCDDGECPIDVTATETSTNTNTNTTVVTSSQTSTQPSTPVTSLPPAVPTPPTPPVPTCSFVGVPDSIPRWGRIPAGWKVTASHPTTSVLSGTANWTYVSAFPYTEANPLLVDFGNYTLVAEVNNPVAGQPSGRCEKIVTMSEGPGCTMFPSPLPAGMSLNPSTQKYEIKRGTNVSANFRLRFTGPVTRGDAKHSGSNPAVFWTRTPPPADNTLTVPLQTSAVGTYGVEGVAYGNYESKIACAFYYTVVEPPSSPTTPPVTVPVPVGTPTPATIQSTTTTFGQ